MGPGRGHDPALDKATDRGMMVMTVVGLVPLRDPGIRQRFPRTARAQFAEEVGQTLPEQRRVVVALAGVGERVPIRFRRFAAQYRHSREGARLQPSETGRSGSAAPPNDVDRSATGRGAKRATTLASIGDKSELPRSVRPEQRSNGDGPTVARHVVRNDPNGPIHVRGIPDPWLMARAISKVSR